MCLPPWRLIPRQIQPQKTVGKSRALKLLTLNSTADKLISGNDERRNRLRVLLIISLASLFVFWPSLGKTQEESLVLYFSFDKEVDKNDLKQENIVIDKSSLEMLKGSQVDYTQELIGSSFKISNPKTKSSCGCGVSFSF